MILDIAVIAVITILATAAGVLVASTIHQYTTNGPTPDTLDSFVKSMVTLFLAIVTTIVNTSVDGMIGNFDHTAGVAVRNVSGLIALIAAFVFDTIVSRMLRESSDKRMLREILNEHHVVRMVDASDPSNTHLAVVTNPGDETGEQEQKPKRPVALYVTSALTFGTTFLTIVL